MDFTQIISEYDLDRYFDSQLADTLDWLQAQETTENAEHTYRCITALNNFRRLKAHLHTLKTEGLTPCLTKQSSGIAPNAKPT